MRWFLAILVAGTAGLGPVFALEDEILLPPVPAVDQTEIWEPAELKATPPGDTAPSPEPEKLDLEDIIIYGRDRYKTTPGQKLSADHTALLIPKKGTYAGKRDNLYYQLPHVENKFLLANDWLLRDRPLSKCYLSYGAWNTLQAKLIVGRQNFLLRTDQLVDLFLDFNHQNSSGHLRRGDDYLYFFRSEKIKGSCLYEIEKNVETQTYLNIENSEFNQPNRYRRRTLADYRLGTVLNAYKGDYASANINLAITTGSLEDSAHTKITYTSSFVQARGLVKLKNLSVSGVIDYLDYGTKFPENPQEGDTTKEKTKLFSLRLQEEGYSFYQDRLILAGGLYFALYKNYLEPHEAIPVFFPNVTLQYLPHRNFDCYLSYTPELKLTTFREVFEHNPYLGRQVEIAPQEKWADICLGGEFRYPEWFSVSTLLGHERIQHYPRYQFNPDDTLYEVWVTPDPDSLYTSSEVKVNKFSVTVRTKEFYHTLAELFLHYHAASFVSGDAPVPFYPRYKAGLVVAGKWFYEIENRVYLYRVAPRSWGPGPGQTLPPYTVLDLSLTRELNDSFKVYLEGYLAEKNIYRLWAGYSEPNFKVSTGIRYRW